MKISTFRLIFLLLAMVLSFMTQASGQSEISNLDPKIAGLHLVAAESFLVARERILKAGWKTDKMHYEDNYEYSGTETEALELGIAEIYSCTVDAGSLCTFYYRKDDVCLRVNTIGEQVKDMTVTHWLFQCPPDWLRKAASPLPVH